MSFKACHNLGNALIESVNEDDYNYSVLQIIVGPQKSCDENSEDDIPELVRKINVTLEDSPMEIMPFIKSCTRNANIY